MHQTPREQILKKIRKALGSHRAHKFDDLDWGKTVYTESPLNREETFAQAFTAIGGHFIFCENEDDFLKQLTAISQEGKWEPVVCVEEKICKILDKIRFPYSSKLGTEKSSNVEDKFPEGIASITACEALVARLGAVMVSSGSESGRQLVVVPTTHVVLAYVSQLVNDLKDAFELIQKKYGQRLPSQIVSIAGPSRTADIEKSLVTPAHGPRDLFVFLIDEQ